MFNDGRGVVEMRSDLDSNGAGGSGPDPESL